MTDYNDLAKKAVDDREAFEKLYRTFYPRIYNFIFARFKNSATADDLTAEVFLKMFRHLAEYRGESMFSTWLFSIAFNEIANFYRASARIQERHWEEFFDMPTSPEDNPEARLLLDENHRELLEALDNLSPRDRRIVELRYFAELSQKEIAGLMNLTQSNVGVILHRSLNFLKNFFGAV